MYPNNFFGRFGKIFCFSKKSLTLFKIVLSILALIYVFRIVDFRAFLNMFKNTNILYFVLALLIFNISKIISSIRLNKFYLCVGLSMSQFKNLKLYYVGMFYNLFLPGSIGGDGYKVLLLKHNTQIKTKQIIFATLMDRISGVSILLSFCLIFFTIAKVETVFGFILYTSISMLGSLFMIWIYYHFLKLFLPYFILHFSVTTILSLFVQAGQAICAAFLLMSLGINHNMPDYLLLFMVSSLVSILPITIGGVGAREFVFIFGFKYLPVDKTASIAFTSLFFSILVISALIGLFFVPTIDK